MEVCLLCMYVYYVGTMYVRNTTQAFNLPERGPITFHPVFLEWKEYCRIWLRSYAAALFPASDITLVMISKTPGVSIRDCDGMRSYNVRYVTRWTVQRWGGGPSQPQNTNGGLSRHTHRSQGTNVPIIVSSHFPVNSGSTIMFILLALMVMFLQMMIMNSFMLVGVNVLISFRPPDAF